jgi:hypothetical protein
MTLLGLAGVVVALLARTSWLPAGARVPLLVGGVVVFSLGLIVLTAGAR